ncbi:Acetoacetate decarboxylase [Mycobacterium sp. smrl_JER01]
MLSYRSKMAVFLRKLFRIGKLPSALRAEVEAEGVLFMSEYVAVTRRFKGTVPGLRSGGSIASYVGSLVVTNERVLATLSSLPKLAGRTIDLRWDAPESGAVKAELSETGLTLDVDVAAVDPRCSGELSLHYKEHLPSDVLARLTRRTLAFDVPPEYIFRAVGVPYHP